MLPLYVVWGVWLATGGGDLAAQLAWADIGEHHLDNPYIFSWYGGMHAANYSLVSPALMSLVGVRALTIASGLAATWAAAQLLARTSVQRPLWPALLTGLTLWCNVASGRTTFALGVAFGLAACLSFSGPPGRGAGRAAVGRKRTALAVACSVLATAASPVAGLFLLVVGAGYALDRQFAKAGALALPFLGIAGATALLFPFHGEQPMYADRLFHPLLYCAAVCLAAPASWRVVRYSAAVYAAGVVLSDLVASPVGTNVERLAELAAPPVLLAALVTHGAGAPIRRRARAETSRISVLFVTLCLSAAWVAEKTVEDLVLYTTVPAWAADTDGVIGELRRLDAERWRVEVLPARNHREAPAFAPHVHMARGWNRQLDVERGRLFYDGTLTPATYRQWLRHWSVRYVVTHDGRPDGPAEREAAVIRSGPEWLDLVWQDTHWKIYRFRDAVPLAAAPATVTGSTPTDITVTMPRPGTATLRVPYSPWLTVTPGCLAESGPWIRLKAPTAGTYRVTSTYNPAGIHRC
ncbi:hypothetical protein RKE29_17385 [Streptomyces sp. B1866]|uniref:hypothetical protein n=1 Tax=Streptomyces sp. B1866 TaxID=3075431 RepID=UPI0028915223|nr:hypothetical protein [Streptomyces sp. B1866]MDT3398399.1 hypothetical protein [Streptomyces sp. B1866]